MANHKPRSARTTNDINAPEQPTNFYESLPLTGYPHSIYRDDDMTQLEQPEHDEQAEAATQLTALMLVAGVTIITLGLIVLLAYGLMSIDT